MSHYVTCINANDSISARVQFNFHNKYEAALVEFFIPEFKKIDLGKIQLYNNKNVVFSISLSSVNSLEDLITKLGPIKFIYNMSNITISAKENEIFKLDAKAIKLFKLDGAYSKSLTIEKTVFQNNSLFHVCSNIVAEQIIGDERMPVLRTISATSTHQIFERPHYIDISQTNINNINICLKDEFFNEFKFSGTALFKIHLRVKK